MADAAAAAPAPATAPAPAGAGGAPAEGDRGDGGQRRFGARGPRRGPPRRRGDRDEWNPVTKLGRLVKYGKITTLEEIFRFSIPIKEPQIVDEIMKKSDKKLDEEVMKVAPIQKQTQAGQRTRFKAWVLVGDHDGHLGLGIKAAKEVQTAIKGAIMAAKLNIAPVRRGYWGNKIGNPHTIPCKVQGKSGSIRVRLIPAPRGTGLVAAATSKKVLQMAGIHDVFTRSKGNTKTKGNFIAATFDTIRKTYRVLTPDLWGKCEYGQTPFEVYADDLKRGKEKKEYQGERRGGDRGDRGDRPRGPPRGDRY